MTPKQRAALALGPLAVKTHGMTSTATYQIWRGMIQRCTLKTRKEFPHYGGRGIFVCARWLDFQCFFEDMGERPAGLSLERMHNDGPYSPDNCIWATRAQQQSNRRTNRLIEFNGETKTLHEWAQVVGVADNTLHSRLQRWTVSEALSRRNGGRGYRSRIHQ